MGSNTYTLFFELARESKEEVVISTNEGTILGYVEDLHSDGVFIVTSDKVLFAVSFEQISFVGFREPRSSSYNSCRWQ